ncbi:ABC-type amino acid transporter [Candidatus Rhodobacter oscarellae]|uniref:ABC-type amino acid transporter n=1 Tax=Candidatus Rhodobacter oscarellae TaxID=1675527 RepID=A0A0J9E2V6_9RHOB|nr:transporter substrate-binding domain-containing protein [Candidatus Rhodobacter lobularis]KMW57186.1 ABC-type amino acid transporter [Candidatus Rhodobacter lobularis]
MKKLAHICAITALLWGASPALADQRTLTVVADEWPPFSGEALPNKGISLDVISTILTRAGYEVRTSVLPWARIMSMATEQDIEIVGSLFFDPEMTEFVTYAEPFFSTDVRLVAQTGSVIAYTSVEDLRPYSIAVGTGFLYQDEFDQADYLNKVEVTTTLQAMRMLADGRVDLTLDSEDVINYSFRNHDPSLAQRIALQPGVLASQDIHMAVGNSVENRDAIIADFNRVLGEMRADGSLDQLLAVHTGG